MTERLTLEAYARKASIALTHCAGLVGSEAFTKIGDEYYADPDFCQRRNDEKFERLTKWKTLGADTSQSTGEQ